MSRIGTELAQTRAPGTGNVDTEGGGFLYPTLDWVGGRLDAARKDGC
jgi:hypothetical protein